MRDKKISADISKKAAKCLDDYCKKHQRSKGFVIDELIIKHIKKG